MLFAWYVIVLAPLLRVSCCKKKAPAAGAVDEIADVTASQGQNPNGQKYIEQWPAHHAEEYERGRDFVP